MSKIKRKDTPSALKAEGALTFLNAFQTYKEECALFEREWDEGTQERYTNYIKNRIVPHLRNHDHTPIQQYTLEDFLHVIDEIKRLGKRNDPNHFDPYEDSMLRKFWHIIRTVVSVASMHESFPNVFDGTSVESKELTEAEKIQQMKHLWLTPKSLSVNEEQQVAAYLLENMDRGENIALFLMYALGLRNEEACGVNFGHIHEMKEYPGHYYLTVSQSTRNHTNIAKVEMKTYNAYRNIPLPQLAVAVLFELRIQRINALNQSPQIHVPISDMWIAYRGNDPFCRCGADDVTNQANKMFEELGMRERISELSDYLQLDSTAIEDDQVDLDEFRMVEKKPTAYYLRRTFATAMAILQLTDSEQAYIVGHVIEDPLTARSDFLDERELFAIKQKMDKRPILNTISNFPNTVLKSNTTIQTTGYSNDFTVPADARRVVVSGTAKEPNDPVHVTVFLSETAAIHEEVGALGVPYPHHFHRTTNVLKAYHSAYEPSQN